MSFSETVLKTKRNIQEREHVHEESDMIEVVSDY